MERREMKFKMRLRGKTKMEEIGLTLAELNDPITEIINKEQTTKKYLSSKTAAVQR